MDGRLYLNTFLDKFIGPKTGRGLCPTGYILEGDDFGIAYPSSSLADLQLELIQLRQNLNILRQAAFVISFPNTQLEYAQILSELQNGFVYNTKGVISTRATTQKLPLCYAATTADLGATYDNGENGVDATLTGNSLFGFTIDGQNPPINSIILVKDQTSAAENGVYVLTDTGDIINPWVLTRLDIYDQSEEIQSGDLVSVANGTLNANTLWVESETIMTVGTDNISFLPFSANVLQEKYIFLGNAQNRAVASQFFLFDNFPNVTYKKILRADITNRLVESDDLTNVESSLSSALSDLASLLSTVNSLISIVNGLQAAVAEIEAGLILIGGFAAVIILQTQVLALEIGLAALTARVDTLEQEMDAIQTQVNGLTVNLIGEVTGTGLLSGPITTELQLTLDEIKVAQDTVDLNDQRITHLSSTVSDETDAMNFNLFIALINWEATVTWTQE